MTKKEKRQEVDETLDRDQQSDQTEPQEPEVELTEIEILQKELEAARADSIEAQERSLRMLAELDNTKKRLERDKIAFVQYAAERIIRDLLPILDSFQQAVQNTADEKTATDGASMKGIRLIYDQLQSLIKKEGVERMETVGKPFDPNLHEAVMQVPVEDGQPEEQVVEELQIGYTMHGKVLRPAMVKISKS